MFNDPMLQFQTYLTGIDGPGFLELTANSPVLNIDPVWEDYRGRNVSVGISGPVDRLHEDLIANYDTSFLAIFDPEPLVQTLPAASIGTFLAGIVAADDNGVGLVGLAPDSSITAFLNEPFAGTDIAITLPRGDRFDTSLAGFESAAGGRGGLGTIVVTAPASGTTNFNTGGEGVPYKEVLTDYALHNERHVITSSAITHTGNSAPLRLEGDMMLVGAAAYTDTTISTSGFLTLGLDSRDGFGANAGSLGFWQTLAEAQTGVDIDGPQYLTEPTGLGGSAVTAGVVALMLEANPNLGWRDVQEILAYSAELVGYDPGANTGFQQPWQANGAQDKNGGGLFYKGDVGFGSVDVYGAVRLAETWQGSKTSANEASLDAVAQQSLPTGIVSFDPVYELTFDAPDDFRIEHVELNIDYETSGSFQSTNADELVLSVISPSGTVSFLTGADIFLTASSVERYDQTYTSRRFWGENADEGNGVWTVRFESFGSFVTNLQIRDLDLTFYGDAAADDTSTRRSSLRSARSGSILISMMRWATMLSTRRPSQAMSR